MQAGTGAQLIEATFSDIRPDAAEASAMTFTFDLLCL